MFQTSSGNCCDQKNFALPARKPVKKEMMLMMMMMMMMTMIMMMTMMRRKRRRREEEEEEEEATPRPAPVSMKPRCFAQACSVLVVGERRPHH